MWLGFDFKSSIPVVGSPNVGNVSVTWLGSVTGSIEINVFGADSAAGLPAGQYTFVVSLVGCDPGVAQVNVIAGTTITQNFELQC